MLLGSKIAKEVGFVVKNYALQRDRQFAGNNGLAYEL